MFEWTMPSSGERVRFPYGVKRELFQAQGGRCMYCGGWQRLDLMDIDHKQPLSPGGSDDGDNLQLLCRTCNTRKGPKTDQKCRRIYRDVGMSAREMPPARAVRQSDFVAAGKRSTQSRNKRQRAERNRDSRDELYRLYLG